MARFSMKSIIEASPNSTVKPEFLDQTPMFIANNSGVYIDGQIVYSIQCDQQNQHQVIVKQNIQTGSSQIVSKLPDNFFVESLLLNKDTQSIFVSGACLEQEKSLLNEYQISTGTLLTSTSYDAKIVMELLQLKHFCFLGCSDNILKIMDITTRQLQSVNTALGIIFSMEFCVIPGDNGFRVVLALGGKMPDYSNQKTDLFDVTALFDVSLLTKEIPTSTIKI